VKPRFSNQRSHALTLVEVLVVIVVLAVLVAILLPTLRPPRDIPSRIYCVNNLKEICLAYRIWEGDHGDKYPMQTSITNGGAMELTGANDWLNFSVLSNELTTPKILICPADTNRIAATNFTTDFNNSNISYFIGLDVTDIQPQMFFSGDDNFVVDGIPIKSGLMQLSTNSNVAWASGRHISYNAHFWTTAGDKFVGNISFTDGSVQQLTQSGLRQALQQTGVATNRLAIP
jgi:prepilin-type N-terminal cleavage/methylation domain-containing protein